MKRYLGLSEAEMTENERMWAEEQGDVDVAPAEPAGLRSVGVTPGGISSDLDALPPAEGDAGLGGGPVNAGGTASPVAAGPGMAAPNPSVPGPT